MGNQGLNRSAGPTPTPVVSLAAGYVHILCVNCRLPSALSPSGLAAQVVHRQRLKWDVLIKCWSESRKRKTCILFTVIKQKKDNGLHSQHAYLL